MSSITITLPDGSQQQVPAGSKPIDIARSISPRLADDAVVARVNGNLFDLTRPFDGDAELQILTSKNPEALEVYRHSTAHLLAVARMSRTLDCYLMGCVLRLPSLITGNGPRHSSPTALGVSHPHSWRRRYDSSSSSLRPDAVSHSRLPKS